MQQFFYVFMYNLYYVYFCQIKQVPSFQNPGEPPFNYCNLNYASVAEWLRVWDTLTMFEATVCGRS